MVGRSRQSDRPRIALNTLHNGGASITTRKRGESVLLSDPARPHIRAEWPFGSGFPIPLDGSRVTAWLAPDDRDRRVRCRLRSEVERWIERLRSGNGSGAAGVTEHGASLYRGVERIGQLLSYSSLSRDIGASVDSIRRWTRTLESLYYCFSVRPWYKNVTRSLQKEPKYFLWDWSQVKDLGARAPPLGSTPTDGA